MGRPVISSTQPAQGQASRSARAGYHAGAAASGHSISIPSARRRIAVGITTRWVTVLLA
jgi:hypothetical protein